MVATSSLTEALLVTKVDGKKNFADISTKPIDRVTLQRHLGTMHFRMQRKRSDLLPEMLK